MVGRNPAAYHFKRIKQAADKPLVNLKRGKLRGADITYIREEKFNIDHCPITVRRVYINTSESGPLADIGWVINEGIPCCLCCHKKFTKFVRRHHCRACGLLICASCSRMAKLASFQTSRAKRVCNSCVIPGTSEPTAVVFSQKNWGKPVFDASVNVSINLEQDTLSKGKRATLAAPESLTIMPVPGFVIKVRRTTHDESKIFINVFHCPTINDKFKLLTHTPETEQVVAKGFIEQYEKEQTENENEQPNIMRENSGLRSLSKCSMRKKENITSALMPTKGGFPLSSPISPVPTHIFSDYSTYTQYRRNRTTISALAAQEIRMLPIIYIGAPTTTVDKDDQVSMLYSVLVSSAYFSETASLTAAVSIAHPSSVNKIIQAVNAAHNESLCELFFSLPRIRRGYMCPISTCLKSETFTRSESDVVHVSEEKIATMRYIHRVTARTTSTSSSAEPKPKTLDSPQVRVNKYPGRVALKRPGSALLGTTASSCGRGVTEESPSDFGKVYSLYHRDRRADVGGGGGGGGGKFNAGFRNRNTSTLTPTPSTTTTASSLRVQNNSATERKPTEAAATAAKEVTKGAKEVKVARHSLGRDSPTETTKAAGTTASAPILPMRSIGTNGKLGRSGDRRAASSDVDQRLLRNGNSCPKHRSFNFNPATHRQHIYGRQAWSAKGQGKLHDSALEFVQEQCINSLEARNLKQSSIQNRNILVGWQILILKKGELSLLGLAVITGVRTNMFFQTEYRISTDVTLDCWVRLKRQKGYGGTEFQPLRKVLTTKQCATRTKVVKCDGGK